MENQKQQNNALQIEDILYDEENQQFADSSIFMIFGFDEQVLSKIVQHSKKVLIVCQNSENESSDADCGKGLYIKLFPKLNQFNETWCYHPKVYLIKFPKKLRIVIGTSNLYSGDWASWENCFYMRDFQQFDKTNKANELNFFRLQLDDILETCLNFEQKKYLSLMDVDINQYDINECDVFPIYSIPGRYNFDSTNIAFNQIKNILQKNKGEFEEPSSLLIYTSSMGVLSETFIEEILFSFDINKKLIDKENFIRVYFPSKDYADSAYGVEQYGVPLFFTNFCYQSQNFKREFLHQFSLHSNDKNLSHVKMIIKVFNDQIDDSTVIYFGSHNLSQAAWGRQLKNHTKVANLEVGIVWPYCKGSKQEKQEFLNLLNFNMQPCPYTHNQHPHLSISTQIVSNYYNEYKVSCFYRRL